MVLKDNIKFLFTGDSITCASRDLEAYQPYGKGYVHFSANYLMAKYPELNFQMVNTGISGNTTVQLLARFKADCIAHKADIVTILVGINDLWRRYKTFDKSDSAVYPKQYEENYRKMLDEIYDSGSPKVILFEPFMFCSDEHNEMFRELKKYQHICRKLASAYPVRFVGIQDEINSLLRYTDDKKWSNDMIHPLPWGHMWLSHRWLEAVMTLK